MQVSTYLKYYREDYAATRTSFLSDKQRSLDKKIGLSKSFLLFQRKLLGVFQEFVQNNEELFEGRNDIKLIILSSSLTLPREFIDLEITEENKEKFIRYLLAKKRFIELKREGDEVALNINSSIEMVFTKHYLNKLVQENLLESYNNIVNVIKENLYEEFGSITPSEERVFSNVKKRILEAMSIKALMPNTKREPGTEGGTFYRPHPNGEGRFPDYVVYIGSNPNEDAKNLKEVFSIKTKKVYVESKAASRMVGKQTRPEKLRKDLNDDALFKKLASIKTGQEGPNFSGREMKKLLLASDIDIRVPVIFLNVTGKTRKNRAKSLNIEIKDGEVFSSRRTSPGQIGFYKDDVKMFGFEIGSLAYKEGEFKEEVLNNVRT